jgi:hypothetical protein
MRDRPKENSLEGFAFNRAECETAVTAHKVDDFIKLPIDETCIVRDDGHCDDRTGLNIVVVHFGNRDIEPALESFNNTFYNFSLVFERSDSVQIKPG